MSLPEVGSHGAPVGPRMMGFMSDEPEYEEMFKFQPDWRERLEDLPREQQSTAYVIYEQVSGLLRGEPAERVIGPLRGAARGADLDETHPWIDAAAQAISRGELFMPVDEPED